MVVIIIIFHRLQNMTIYINFIQYKKKKNFKNSIIDISFVAQYILHVYMPRHEMYHAMTLSLLLNFCVVSHASTISYRGMNFFFQISLVPYP